MFLQYFLKFLITQQSHVYSFLWLQLPEHRVRAVSEHLLVVNLMMKNLTFYRSKTRTSIALPPQYTANSCHQFCMSRRFQNNRIYSALH